MSEQAGETRVRQFRQILLWPLQLMPLRAGSQIQMHWEVLEAAGSDSPWHEVLDEFTEDGGDFQARHYYEFVTFLPYVQRFLYGESRARKSADGAANDLGASPMRIFRRDDIAAVRIVTQPGARPITLSIQHTDLIFFYDIDVVLLNVEVHADDLSLVEAQELLYRFGRAYPAGWDENGDGLHCNHSVEWIGTDGTVLAASDSGQRERFLSFVGQHRAPRISSHWSFMLRPLVLDHEDEPGAIRFRQLEYYRMPVMGYLAVDNPRAIGREDFIRLGLVVGSNEQETTVFSERHVADFEERHCYDRFWGNVGRAPHTRYLCCGHALVVVGDADASYFLNQDIGVLGQFRHQHFLLFLIAHFQKAALLMFSDRLVEALKRLDIGAPESVKRFKRTVRGNFEIFLRFTHRYWFHEISDQAQTKALFKLCTGHLGLDPMYAEVRDEIREMNQYLDTDSQRRQANTVVRLTVVTTFGLIGTVTTGFLGMNLLAAAESPFSVKLLLFLLIFVPTVLITLYTIAKSRRLSDFLDALSDEEVSARETIAVLIDVWRRRRTTEN